MVKLFETVIVVVLLLFAAQQFNIFDVSTFFAADAAPTAKDIAKDCFNVDSVTVKLDARDKFKQDNTLDGNNYYRKVDGVRAALSSVSDGSTFVASVGHKFDVYAQLNGLDYYTTFTTIGPLPCESTYEATIDVFKEGNLTFRLFADDSGDLLSSTVNETLNAGDTVTLRGAIYSEADKGMPYGGIIVMDYSRNNYTSSDIVMTLGGVTLVRTSTPIQHVSPDTSMTQLAWKFPVIMETIPQDWSVTLAASSSFNPGANGFAVDGNKEAAINITVYDFDYVQTDEGDVVLAVEDPDDFTDVGDSNDKYGLIIN